MKGIKLSNYFEIVKPKYIYLKLTPNYSVRNHTTDQIAKAICSLYRSLNQSIYRYEKKFFYEARSKVAYYIYIEKTKAEFYFVLPEAYKQLVEEKIMNSWKGITIEEVQNIPLFSKNADKYYLTYKKEDGLSLQVDKRANTLLSSLLNVIPVMQEGDKVGIFYNFVPCSQLSWRATYEKTMEKLKEGMPVDREKTGGAYIVKMLMMVVLSVLTMIENAMFSAINIPKRSDSFESLFFNKLNAKELTAATIQKKERAVVDTQILVLSESKDMTRQSNNSRAICASFHRISGDNELIHRRARGVDLNPDQLYIQGADTIKVSTDECQNFLQLPGRELLEEHGCIAKIETKETEVPEELQRGTMHIGYNTYRGTRKPAYLSNDREFRNLTLTVIGPTRAGKTTLFQNLTKDAIYNNECVIIPDFISWCQFSHEISEVIPKERQLIIDCEDFRRLEGFGFNELWINTDNIMEKYESAKRQTAQLLTLVDGVNASDKSLSAKMDRYLESAALVVFSKYGSLNDVFEVLRNCRTRHDYINKIGEDEKYLLSEYIETLMELDEKDKKTGEVIGTRLNLITGILDRINRLKRNTAMEIMLKNSCDNNINLLEEIQKPQLIVIRMPDSKFSTETEKDFMCTYWFSKIWLTLQLRDTLIRDRKKRVKVNILWDELYQIPYTQALLKDKLSQIAKFDAKNIISCHYLGQIGIIRDELKAANSSYMLISGCDKDNYKELKDELYPYTLDDLLNLKRYHSLNLIKYEKGWAKFITKLPPPIK